MIKAIVEIPFYEKKGKELYLDEERFKELERQGYVKKAEVIETASIKGNGKRKVLSDKGLEVR
jgi:hypothetical protein|nr:MAG TPA: hypothetical protein [Caudoviricetes sp.]